MIVANQELLDAARQYKSELIERMFGISIQAIEPEIAGTISAIPISHNIVGVGYGVKMTGDGTVHADLAVRVYVRSKLPRRLPSPAEEVPLEINGTPTDVIAVGDIVTLVRPAPGGVSVGHPNVTAGTLGCLVRPVNMPDENPYILSNNHVLANSNSAQIGDPILQPSPIDGGRADDAIAELKDFEQVEFAGNPNSIDAAIARVFNSEDVLPEILGIGRIQQPPILETALYQSVRKRGRTTLQTVGLVVDLSADIQVLFGTSAANFENQIAIVGMNGSFSAGGDSGSLILDAISNRVVGLLFAGGGNLTFANPIGAVLSRFQVEIL